ncbi:2-dehydro-3-deoxygalactonokinase [Aquamicrobium sp. LC103]|uniref:2-dehydro-3-deoxygalactonokinase n=1 Tax=Aquamicrobium sp. LC103 TaxID=1120658 RepID=UPI00063ECE98|nr:2-dehydro-3-deoxygalactonokinase [Aquamicrobium sp. LC103]TKT79144.1 2-dehydro-3-deoxygalactonokinase [Aquamicrobium sp. LC103]
MIEEIAAGGGSWEESLANTPASIIVDWGTTSLRAALVTATGMTVAARETEGGIQFVEDRRFEAALMDAVGDWFEAHGLLPVLAIGMITSRNGWIEVPYVDAPAGVDELAGGTHSITLGNGATLTFLAGLRNPAGEPFPDVMRGEETQIVGFGLERDMTLVLPGTHSKWARMENGRIDRFQTYVTGEVFALLTRHSFIARTAAPQAGTDVDWAAFERGAKLAAGGSPASDAFLALIFSARTGILDGKLAPAEIADYVSGLVIGSEFRQARAAGWFSHGDRIGIVGNDGLNDRYRRVAPLFGLSAEEGPADAATKGVLAISDRLPRRVEPA